MTDPARVERVRAGDRRAMAALMRDLDDERAGARAEVRALHAAGGRDAAFVVGVTGPPGAGKSTLVSGLLGRWRGEGRPVGVVAVDPSSPFSGGAVLGDRVRMQGHATDPGVFIRSLATRGALGGLSRSTADVIAVLAAGGFGTVLVETVGVGQAEIDVAATADVTVVVLAPGLGDDVQALKAGILEIADLLVLNKADRPGADRAAADLEAALELGRASRAPEDQTVAPPPLLRTVATTGEGLDPLVAALEERRAAAGSDQALARRRARAVAQLVALVAAAGARAARDALAHDPDAARLADAVAARTLDPVSAAEALMARLGRG